MHLPKTPSSQPKLKHVILTFGLMLDPLGWNPPHPLWHAGVRVVSREGIMPSFSVAEINVSVGLGKQAQGHGLIKTYMHRKREERGGRNTLHGQGIRKTQWTKTALLLNLLWPCMLPTIATQRPLPPWLQAAGPLVMSAGHSLTGSLQLAEAWDSRAPFTAHFPATWGSRDQEAGDPDHSQYRSHVEYESPMQTPSPMSHVYARKREAIKLICFGMGWGFQCQKSSLISAQHVGRFERGGTWIWLSRSMYIGAERWGWECLLSQPCKGCKSW